jgi:glutamate 5-kinase
LMFTDNDELAGLVAALLNADALLILSNVDGIFDGDPSRPESKVIRHIAPQDTGFAEFVTATRSQFGRGGMLTKCSIAHKVAGLGISVHIANGKTPNILPNILNETAISTWFQPSKKASGTKKWLAHAQSARATVQVNAGARGALLAAGQATSLLPVGIVAIEGEFAKGDLVRLTDEAGQALGLGIAEYGADKARERLGQHGQRPLVHYDYLFLTLDT